MFLLFFHTYYIVGDLFHQKVDLVVASVALNYRRVPFIDYLPPLNFEISSIFIPESYEKEMADVNTFINPLHKNTWLAVFTLSLFVAITKILGEFLFLKLF